MERIFELCKEIGILTFGDLQRFKKEELQEGEDLEAGLFRYLIQLGEGWKIAENNL